MTEFKMLTVESFPLKNERKGGAANILLASLLLEATRMLDDGNLIHGVRPGLGIPR